MLVVENVSHGFGARTILENVSFRLRKGEHIALVGANGEGKSTFLNIITKKLMPDAGNIKLNFLKQLNKTLYLNHLYFYIYNLS
jgi:ATPase subunit of ABC transporter with duplicated ATPase domains